MSGGSVLVRTPVGQTEGDGSTPIPPLQLRVEPVEFAHVSPFLREYHYLKRNPVIPHRAFAVFAGWRCVGALVFGQPAGGLGAHTGTWELQRYWLSDECGRNSESRVLGYCIRWIRKHCPDVNVLLSYSDPARGHTGIIYKATGFRLVGKSRAHHSLGNSDRVSRAANGTHSKLKWELAL